MLLPVLTAKNKPGNDPLAVQIQKVDPITNQPTPTGNGTLSGAVFRLQYYDNINDSTNGSPKMVWHFKTNANGLMYVGEAELASGYTNSPITVINGTRRFPYGTYTFEEIKAPNGYTAPSGIAARYVSDENGVRKTYGATYVENDASQEMMILLKETFMLKPAIKA